MKIRYNPKKEERTTRVPWTTPWRVLLPVVTRPKNPASAGLVLVIGFAAMIAIGAILLILPISSKAGQFTNPVNALFTATSAVCVTGLNVLDTAGHFSIFGQVVILVLIQIGGFGFMTLTTLFLLAFGRRIGLKEKILISESTGITQLGGLGTIVGQMAVYTVLSEAIGAILLYMHFAGTSLPTNSLWLSGFQSISAFNNAGFDLHGGFQSLTGFQNSPLVLLVTAALIILGGINFFVIRDLIKARKISRLSLDSKLVLLTTGFLLVIGTLVILLTEFNNKQTLGNLSSPLMILNAFFQSVTTRTAGFSSVNINALANYTLFFMMFLMFIGGSSGSTAGGIKVNTFSMLSATIWSTLRGKEHPGAFGRQFASQQIYRALAVVLISIGFVAVVVLLLTMTEGFQFIDLLFETISAFGTVGLSTGITPSLSVTGQLIIAVTMFVGRLGPLTLTLTLVQRQQATTFQYPQDTIRIG